MSWSTGIVSTTRNIGISRMASIIESRPIRKRSASPCGTLGDSNSQKRTRTIAETSSSLDFSSPAVRVATRRTHLRTSRSPNSVSACRIECTSF